MFDPTARIFLTGTIDTGDEFYEPVRLAVYDSNDNVIVHAKSVVNDNEFFDLITGPLGSFDEGIYVIEATHPSTTKPSTSVIEIDESVGNSSTLMHLTPLKQIDAGTELNQVVCSDKHVLIQNNHKHSVACVEPLTAIILEQRGWGEF